MNNKSSNVILNGKAIKDSSQPLTMSDSASRQGVLIKLVIGLIIMAAMFVMIVAVPGIYEVIGGLYLPLSLIFIAFYIFMIFRVASSVRAAKQLFFVYAIVEGLLVGFISATLERQYSGIILGAVAITIALVAAATLIYAIKPEIVSNRFVSVVSTMVLGVFIFYLANFFLSIFGVTLIDFNSNFSIGISIFILILASALLMVDYRRVDQIVKSGAGKEYEWLLALGILTTIVWIYIEALKLLTKLRSR